MFILHSSFLSSSIRNHIVARSLEMLPFRISNQLKRIFKFKQNDLFYDGRRPSITTPKSQLYFLAVQNRYPQLKSR